MVRPSLDPCPVITLFGAMFPFAILANAATRGWLTQLGTRISPRLVSYASAMGLPNPGVGVPAGALLRLRFGAVLPLAPLSNARAVWSPKFEIQISPFLASTAKPIGRLMPV